MKKDFNIKEFSTKNAQRAHKEFNKPVETGNIEYFLIALMGELGEFANAHKKLVRRVNPGTGRDFEGIDFHDMAMELADIQIYLDLLAQSCGVDLAEWVKYKFNKVSDNLDCEIKIK